MWRALVQRRLTTAVQPRAYVYELASQDVFVNLAIEEWVFRTTDFANAVVLLLWRNSKCVVVGRNQNPWSECNMRALRDDAVPFARRRSGGGTVYHDLGNSNYTIMTSRAGFDKLKNSQLVVRALQRLDIHATVSERNDILVSGKKVSGAAYKLTGSGAYHHGTMLLRADVDSLRRYLAKLPTDNIVSKGVASVRSPVMNLASIVPDITHERFSAAMATEFLQSHPNHTPQTTKVSEALAAAMPMVQQSHSELTGWDWLYGQTPEFEHTFRGRSADGSNELELRLKVRDGSIERFTLVGGTDAINTSLQAALAGKRYHPDALCGAINNLPEPDAVAALSALFRTHVVPATFPVPM